MKFCLLTTYPEAFLERHHAAQPHLAAASFKEQSAALARTTPDAGQMWGPTLEDAQHKVQVIVANDVVSQNSWVTEKIPGFKPKSADTWMHEVVVEQLRKFKPDVLCIFDPDAFDARFLRRLVGRPTWIVGYSAGGWSRKTGLRGYDLMLSPHECLVRQAWRSGARDARLFHAGFPRSVAEAVFQLPVTTDVVCCGRWRPDDAKRTGLLKALAEAGQRKDKPLKVALHLDVPPGVVLPSAVLRANQGPVQGLERYQAIRSAAIAVAEEPDEALGDTVPESVFESTGLGLFTFAEDRAPLRLAFEPGAELETYHSPEDLVAKIDARLADEPGRIAIARAGQERCLTEHSMESRMNVFISLLQGNPRSLAKTASGLWHRLCP